jgi:hypothetical protein
MHDRKRFFFSLAAILSLGAGAACGHRSTPTPDPYSEGAARTTSLDQVPLGTPTVVAEATPTNTAESRPNNIRNTMTNAVFEETPDPEFAGKQCLKIEGYSNENKQTVFGATVALGSDAGKYNDIPGPIEVFNADGVKIGEFTTNHMPDPQFGNVLPGTTVCDASAEMN